MKINKIMAEKEIKKSERGNSPDFTENNIQRAWEEFVKMEHEKSVKYYIDECGVTEKEARAFCGKLTGSLLDVHLHKGKRGYNKCVIFLAYSRGERDDIASIEMEARDFFKKRFGDKFYTTYTQCEYIRSECPSAYMAYC